MDDSQITKWLRCIFIHYSKLGPQDSATTQTIDGRRFRQLAAEAPNLLGTYLAMVDVDLAYAKAQGALVNSRRKKLNYSLFLEALMFLSWKRFPEEGTVV